MVLFSIGLFSLGKVGIFMLKIFKRASRGCTIFPDALQTEAIDNPGWKALMYNLIPRVPGRS